MIELKTERRVEFADTDAGGVVHFARFFVFMEAAEHELLRSLSPGLPLEFEGRSLLWPRVSAACNYLKPARFGDLLEVRVEAERRGGSSVSYRYAFRRGEEELALGHIVTVHCLREADGSFRPARLPSSLATPLAPAVEAPS